MQLNFNFTYSTGNQDILTNCTQCNDFTVVTEEKNNVITLTLKPKRPVSFSKFEMSMANRFNSSQRIFTNGFQSWTVTKEYSPNASMDEFNPKIINFPKNKVNPLGVWGSGDLLFHKYPERAGLFYGYTYGYIRDGQNIRLYASLSEKKGYTIITFDSLKDMIFVEKDLEGVIFTEDTVLLELAIIEDEYDSAFDKYFKMMNIPKPRVERKCGYTTWYNYYTGVTEKIVNNDLDAISKLDTKIDIFQIDDGYQRTVGDWLEIDKKKFPSGMKTIAQSIHSKGMMAGLWLAPFAATPKSHIFKEHKDWFVHDEKGKIHYASLNWGGFYAIDIYNEQARAYIKKVFDTVLNDWGYDMVKLDFLFACSIIPINNKSRGEIMCEAMDFLRECCGDKIILGCGVPLGPSFGKVDFCRIGADVGLSWCKKALTREDVSTKNTLMNTIFRRHLDGRAFLNDPDVFLLRDNNIYMPMSKREIIAQINSLCGNLLFVSDDVSRYTPQQRETFKQTVTRNKAIITKGEFISKNVIRIEYILDGEKGDFTFDIEKGERLLYC